MTDYLVDVSRYQVERSDPLDLAQAKAAGFTRVNIALTGGRGYVNTGWGPGYAQRARELGMGVMVYHWLDGRTSGAAQAAQTLARMADYGGPLAHLVDVEETGQYGITPPTYTDVVDYVSAMQDALGRPIMVYSADWWWQPRGWDGAVLTPYLMAAPNAGYRPTYPGDTSTDWVAGYGGWDVLSAMQYAVAPLPGTGDCSLTAIRDPAVWAALTGGPMATSQNGWTASPDKAAIGIVSPTVAGVSFPQGVRGGDVATVLMWVAKRFHETVEPLQAGGCWGYFYRTISGSTSLSNHSSGTAVDFNAPKHPLGSVGTFSARQVQAIRAILTYCGGVVRWGGDYSGRKDEMHFEIDRNAAAVATLARKITGGGQPVPPPKPEGHDIVLVKTKDDATIWISDGMQRRAMASWPAAQALVAAGHEIAVVANLAELEDAAGPVWTLPAPGDDVDPQAVAAAVLTVLTPQAIAAAIPAELADQVADELAARLGS